MFRQEQRFWFPPLGAGTDIPTIQFYSSVPNAKETPNERICVVPTRGKLKPYKSGHSPVPPVGTYSLLRFLHALQKASTHLFPTLSPPPSPLLPLCLNLFIWLLYLTLFNLFHRRASHLRSGDYIASAFVCFVYL